MASLAGKRGAPGVAAYSASKGAAVAFGTALALELWVWYDGQAFARADVLSKVYFAVVDALSAAGTKMGS